jgi:TPR repeat protein
MKDKYCFGYESGTTFIFRDPPKRAKKRSKVLPVLLVVVLGVTGAACWWTDQILTQARAKRGDTDAEYVYGKRCLDHARTPQERDEAVRFIQTAAEQGNPKAQTGLGILYLKGLGVPRDFAAGVKWLHTAAAQNFAVAQNELGVMYATGHGMPRDLDAAIFWCTKAVDQGSKVARNNLDLIQTAKRNHSGQVTTRSGDPCLNVKIQKVESDGVMVAFEPQKGGLGLAKLKTANLPEELKKLSGYTVAAPSKLSALLHLDGLASTL